MVFCVFWPMNAFFLHLLLFFRMCIQAAGATLHLSSDIGVLYLCLSMYQGVRMAEPDLSIPMFLEQMRGQGGKENVYLLTESQ